MKHIVLIVALTQLVACAVNVAGSKSHFEREGLLRAAFDMDCDQANLTYQSLGGSSYGVKGCNKKAVYVLDKFTFIRNSEIQTINN